MPAIMFHGMGAASGAAEDRHSGLIDRLRSLPIRTVAVVIGRLAADSALVAWSIA